MTKYMLPGGLALLAAALTSSSASAAPTQQDEGWRAWYGCWRAEEAPANEYLCIVPDGSSGVRMLTVAAGEVVAESRIVTDGRARVVKQEGCNGTERAHWSADGQRVFLNSDLTCENNVQRKVSGIFAFTSSIEWLSAQAVTVVDQTATRTVRYTAVEPPTLPATITNALRSTQYPRGVRRDAVLARIDAADVDEAVHSIDPSAVQEWLDATGQPFRVIDDSGDQVVTTSALDHVSRASSADYPTREVVHVVERPTYVHTTTYVNTVVRSCWDPFYSGFVLGFGYGLQVGYGYTGCGRHYYSRYSPWGYDLHGWRYRRGPVVVIRGGPTIIRNNPIHRSPPIRHDDDDDRRSRGGIATRDGYRDRSATERAPQPPRTTTTTRTNEYSDESNSTRITRTAQPNNWTRTSPTSRGGSTTRSSTSSGGGSVTRGGYVSPSNGGSVTRSSGGNVTRSSGGSVTRSSGGSVTRSSGGAITRSSGGAVTRSSSGARASSSTQSSGSTRPATSTRTAQRRN